MFGKKFCSALCASSIAFSAASKSDASWKAYDITSGVVQILKDAFKIVGGGAVAALYAGSFVNPKGEKGDEEAQILFFPPVALGLVTAVDGLFSLLSDIGEIGNGITAGRAVQNKEDLEKITKRIEALERNANITDNRAFRR